MTSFCRFIFLFSISVLFVKTCVGQDFVSQYKPKTRTEKLVFAKLKSLPEIKKHYNYKIKGGEPDIVINPPDTSQKYYRFQVGFSYPDIFRTYYWLSIDPKTCKVYFWNFLDTANRDIPLLQWRHWRKNPIFHDNHTWKNGSLIAVK